MKYYRNILCNTTLNTENLEVLLKDRKSKFYFGYLLVTLKNNNSNMLLCKNLELLKKYL